MKIRILSVLVVPVVLAVAAGCTAASSPTKNVEVVKLANERQGWGVHCHGLIQSSKTCFKVASKVCGDKPVQVVYAFDRLESGLAPKEDARDVVFTCGAPAKTVVDTPTSVAADMNATLARVK
jgi:OmpA-OmpF porin, OOP family